MCLTLVTTITAAVIAVPRPAAADQISDLKAEAAQVAQQMIATQLQIEGYQQQYQLASERLQQDALAVAQSRAQLLKDEQRTGFDRARLRRQAILDYTSAVTNDSQNVEQMFESNKAIVITKEYEQVSATDVLADITQLRNAESSQRSVQAALQYRESLDQSASSQAAALDQQATATAAHLQALQSQVNGQLAVAVAQQQAAEAAAVSAELSAAQAARAANLGQLPDPALPPFLQCVRQAESGGNYGAVSPGGTYMGAFQFSQPTWNEAAQLAGLASLIGVPPNQATRGEQDTLAVALYVADGEQPWYDPCRSAGR